ncbi:MAG: hypothetical protein ACOC56_05710 [Atribacterota bacterium]
MLKTKINLIIIIFFIVFTAISCLPPGLLEHEDSSQLPREIPIEYAKVDPAFHSTHIEVIALLPFSNARKYDDAYVIYDNLISKFGGIHSQYKIISPNEVMNKISSLGISDAFNVFLGDYMNTGVANKDFIIRVKNMLDVDAILFGEILSLGSYTYKVRKKNYLTRKYYIDTEKRNRVGLRLGCWRGKDGRKIWEGRHTTKGNSSLNKLASVLSTIFAKHFGKRTY